MKFFTGLLIFNFIASSLSIPILPDTGIELNCANATGSINCEWKCHDACIETYGRDITGTTLKECLSKIDDRTCVIPGIAMTSIELDSCCLRRPSANSDSLERNTLAELACLVPNVTDVLQLKFLTRSVTAAFLDIVTDQLAGKCGGLIQYHTGSNVNETFRSDCSYESDVDLHESSVTFGFLQLNVDLTPVVQKAESMGHFVGEYEQVLHLFTAGECYGDPTETTLFIEEQFILNTTDYQRQSAYTMLSCWTSLLVSGGLLAMIS